MAITAAVIGAAGAAYSADQNNKRAKKAAKAANAPQNSEPFQGQWLAPIGNTWLENQNTLVDQAMHRNDQRFFNGTSPSDAHGAGGGGGGGGRQGRRGGGNGGGGNGKGSGSMYGGVYDAAMGNVGDKNAAVSAGNDFTQEVLGSDSFAGRNKYNEDLYGRLGNASFDQPIDALQAFMAGGSNYGNGGGGGGGGKGGIRMSSGSSSGRSTPRDPGGKIPDTMAQPGWFTDRVNDIWDPSQMDPANNPTLKPYIDAITADSQHAFDRQLGDLKSGLEGAGRMGTGFAIATRNNAADDSSRALNSQIASTYMDDYNNSWDRRMSAMGEVSNRDQAAMGDLTTRYGIDSSAAAQRASASAGAQAQIESARLQQQLGFRGQDLGALEMMMGHQQFGLGQLQGLGNQLTAEQQSTLGNVDDLTAAGLSPLQFALGAAGGQASNEAGARAAANARAAQGLANRRFDFERGVYEDQFAQNSLDHAFRNMATYGGMGGSSTGPQVSPQLSDPFGAAVQGGLGGYTAVRGAQR